MPGPTRRQDYPSIDTRTNQLLHTYSKRQIRSLRAQYGVKLIREIELPEIGAAASRIERAFVGTGRAISAEDARVAATAFIKGERFATADLQFYRRARDLGLLVEFVGSPQNSARAAAYVPRPVIIPH
jgi:hypothetical protein